MTNGTPHNNFFDTEGAVDMLMRLSLDWGLESHLLPTIVSTDVEMCLIAEKD